MRIKTTRGKLIDIHDLDWSAMSFDLLMKLSLSAQNLTLDATEVHTGGRVRVKLFQLDFDFNETAKLNLP